MKVFFTILFFIATQQKVGWQHNSDIKLKTPVPHHLETQLLQDFKITFTP